MAARSVSFTVTNESSYDLTFLKVDHLEGKWVDHDPPASIAAGTKASFRVESTSDVTGVEGDIYYTVEGTDGGTLKMRFDDPFVGDNSGTASTTATDYIAVSGAVGSGNYAKMPVTVVDAT